SLVRATGVPDSTGQAQGQPVYTQGSEKYESREMAFNFKTKKGFINDVKTTQGTGLLYSVDAKRTGDGNFYLQNAQYTTCDAPHPHFYLQLTRAKVTPGKETFFGPAYLVVADVPLPVAIPYGFFPVNKKYSSGLIMPTYGDETARGFYLRDGGYYFALSDRMDLKLLGEIYTRGSWGLSAESNYARRYSYRGNVFLSYLTTVNGDKNMPDYTKQTSLKVQWSHSSDPKANPNTSFSARVNFATQNYERSNLASLYTPLAYTQSTRASSVSFSHSVPSLGLSLSASANVSQDMRNASLSVSLPDVSLSVARFYPLRRSKAVGKERWYE
ncbi:MAG: LPS-assembly protein LptD, partial [Prevotellaceae bacterium]|nr:LPS-assembly protein LptD [Prevotellaceae bacterium]